MIKKKYTEVYLERRHVRCILVESDVDATEQEILEAAELSDDVLTDFKAVGTGNETITSNPEKDIADFKNWTVVKSAY